jgi:hypothetical protein
MFNLSMAGLCKPSVNWIVRRTNVCTTNYTGLRRGQLAQAHELFLKKSLVQTDLIKINYLMPDITFHFSFLSSSLRGRIFPYLSQFL